MKKLLAVLVALTLVLVGCNTTKKEEVNNQPEENVESTDMMLADFVNNLNDYKLIDVRSEEEYIGWDIKGLGKGGHLPNAINFNMNILTDHAKEEVLAYFELLHVAKTDDVIIYGNEGDELESLRTFMTDNGFTSVKTYSKGVQEFAKSHDLDAFVNYQLLVSTRWVNELLAGNDVKHAPAGDYKIYQVGWGNEEQSKYTEGHIPTSVHINTDDFEVVNPEGSYDYAPLWNLKTDAELFEAAKMYGITTDTTVILYGNDTTAAARIMLALRYLGVSDVRLIDGGYNKYVADGFDVSTESTPANAVENFGTTEVMHPEFVMSIEEVETALTTDSFVLASVRSKAEHDGETSGYNYINSMGRIPGDTFVNSGDSAYDMNNYRSLNGTMLSGTVIDANWASAGINKDDEVAFYCGTGWRAAETWFYAELLGYSNYKLFDGGWLEWSDYTGREIEGTLVPNE